MRLNVTILVLASAALLRAQGDFAICQGAGAEILRQGSGNPQTEYCIGYLYASGRGVPRDFGAAATHFRAAAERGYTPAQAVLGVHYAKGLGVPQNWTEAARWYRKAAEAGHAGAAVNLGLCYEKGNGVPQDRNEAVKWYQFGVARGEPRAAGLLAQIGGASPDRVQQNYAFAQQSIPWRRYRVPQERIPQVLREVRGCWVPAPGIVSCQGQLTGNYGQTEIRVAAPAGNGGGPAAQQTYPIPSTPPPAGVPLEQRAAAEQLWQRAVDLLNGNNARGAMPFLYKCALMGDKRAEATLGIRYQDGDGVKADDRAAAYWFGLAAAQGHRASQYALGGMYMEGEGGLPKDLAKATELLIKSANQGYDKAQLALGIAYEFGEGVPRSRPKAIALIRQSGLANEIASVLANPQTPKSFANEDAFAAYLASLRNAQFAASWAQARANRGTSGYDPYFDHNSQYWQNRRWQERPRCENWGCKN